MNINELNIKGEQLEEVCKRFSIKELALFGSVLRDDFNKDSDIDLLYVFEDDVEYSLFDIVRIKEELQNLFNRPVDFVSRKAIERSRNIYKRKSILNNTKVIYAA